MIKDTTTLRQTPLYMPYLSQLAGNRGYQQESCQGKNQYPHLYWDHATCFLELL